MQLAIVETSNREISIANEEWNKGEYLLWPPKALLKLPKIKLLETVSKANWTRIFEFKILQGGLGSIEEANERIVFYSLYENTLDKIQEEEENKLRRKHPLDYLESNHLDYNSMFDALEEYCASTPTSNIAECNLCGLGFESKIGLVKCRSCPSGLFCMDCDKLYHQHPLRTKHERMTVERGNECPAAPATSDANAAFADLTVPTSSKQPRLVAENNGIIPKPLKKVAAGRVTKKGLTKKVQVPSTSDSMSLKFSSCELAAVIQCVECRSRLFCMDCDSIFHKHQLRTEHKRMTVGNECPDAITSLDSLCILDLPVIFEGDLEDTNKEIIDLQGVCNEQMADLNEIGKFALNFGNSSISTLSFKLDQFRQKNLLEIAGIRALTGNLGNQVTRKTFVRSNRIDMQSLTIQKRNLSALNKVRKVQGVMLKMLKKVKTDQSAMKTTFNGFRAQIKNMTEIVNASKENGKRKIEIDESFVMPCFPCKSLLIARNLNKDCEDQTYCDQVALRFQNLTSENLKDVGSAVKRIMAHMFKNSFLTIFSWTGKSGLNSETQQKESFSELSAIVKLIRQAATLNLLETISVHEASLKAVKEVIRRSSQEYAREINGMGK